MPCSDLTSLQSLLLCMAFSALTQPGVPAHPGNFEMGRLITLNLKISSFDQFRFFTSTLKANFFNSYGQTEMSSRILCTVTVMQVCLSRWAASSFVAAPLASRHFSGIHLPSSCKRRMTMGAAAPAPTDIGSAPSRAHEICESGI